jgi:hypothetical protein
LVCEDLHILFQTVFAHGKTSIRRRLARAEHAHSNPSCSLEQLHRIRIDPIYH